MRRSCCRPCPWLVVLHHPGCDRGRAVAADRGLRVALLVEGLMRLLVRALTRYRRPDPDPIAPPSQLILDAAADIDLRLGRGQLVPLLPPGDFTAGLFEGIDEVVGVVQGVDQPRVAEVSDVRFAAATE